MSTVAIDSTASEAATMGLAFRYVLAPTPNSPLILLVHGRAGNREVMWSFRRAIPENCTIVAPEAPFDDPVGGKSWWLIDAEQSASGAPKAHARLIEFLARFESFYGLTPRARIALGFSQGAGTLSVTAQRSGNLFAGIGLLAGFVVETDFSTGATEGHSRPKIFIAHGSADPVVTLARAEAGRDFLQNKKFNVDFHTDPVGHKIGTGGVKALKVWLEETLKN